jgi:IS5 family transposase
MDRCWLQGKLADVLHVVLCAAGYNLRWLLRAMVRLGPKVAILRFLLLQWVSCIRDEQPAADVNTPYARTILAVK